MNWSTNGRLSASGLTIWGTMMSASSVRSTCLSVDENSVLPISGISLSSGIPC
ncbi:secreted protein [Candidatus Thiomargarita nelsonii]|uniref:Secreted protein n=1 Tax=Candidatus Thiomargarita nelsonii TaxID=1003181 RepID=A0A176RUZ3_9GAMM|nr:secreted protein [Candidatus Thiomargarita nelsonii]